MKKLLLLLLLLLCSPLIEHANSKNISKENEYHISNVEIFEDEEYIQINKDGSKIYFPKSYEERLVIYDTLDNGKRRLEYIYIHKSSNYYGNKNNFDSQLDLDWKLWSSNGKKITKKIQYEKREWYTDGTLKYEEIPPYEKREWHDNGTLKYEYYIIHQKPGEPYVKERKYSYKGDLILERALDYNGKEVGWWHQSQGHFLTFFIILIIPLIILLLYFALYRVIRLFVLKYQIFMFKDSRILTFLLTTFIAMIWYFLAPYWINETFLIGIPTIILVIWIILGIRRLTKAKKNKR